MSLPAWGVLIRRLYGSTTTVKELYVIYTSVMLKGSHRKIQIKMITSKENVGYKQKVGHVQIGSFGCFYVILRVILILFYKSLIRLDAHVFTHSLCTVYIYIVYLLWSKLLSIGNRIRRLGLINLPH